MAGFVGNEFDLDISGFFRRLSFVMIEDFHYYKQRFDASYVDCLLKEGQAVDATNGGLILGRSHDEGGIYFLIRQHKDYYCLEGEVEGYEFILNSGANKYFSSYIGDVINKPFEHNVEEFIEYLPSEYIQTIDAGSISAPKYMVFSTGSFAIVNVHSTKAFLNTLNEMNNSIGMIKESIYRFNIEHYSRKAIDLIFNGQKVGEIPARF